MTHDEILNMKDLSYKSINRLSTLDSFIKESVRLNPLNKSEGSLKACNTIVTDETECVNSSQGAAALQLFLRWTSCRCRGNRLCLRLRSHARQRAISQSRDLRRYSLSRDFHTYGFRVSRKCCAWHFIYRCHNRLPSMGFRVEGLVCDQQSRQTNGPMLT